LKGEEIVSIATHKCFTVLLSKKGEIFTAGSNLRGQLGYEKLQLGKGVNRRDKSNYSFTKLTVDCEGNPLPSFKSIKVNFSGCVALSEGNELFYWGKTFFEKRIIKQPKRFIFS
jgi:alpha-tubulin suppressor-like RCC1 family protein